MRKTNPPATPSPWATAAVVGRWTRYKPGLYVRRYGAAIWVIENGNERGYPGEWTIQKEGEPSITEWAPTYKEAKAEVEAFAAELQTSPADVGDY
jgi:hypothetical protein